MCVCVYVCVLSKMKGECVNVINTLADPGDGAARVPQARAQVQAARPAPARAVLQGSKRRRRSVRERV